MEVIAVYQAVMERRESGESVGVWGLSAHGGFLMFNPPNLPPTAPPHYYCHLAKAVNIAGWRSWLTDPVADSS